MTATSGRDFLIRQAGVAIAGLREKSMSFDGSPVDKTSADDNGFRTLADFAGVQSWDMTASGVLKDTDAFRNIALNPTAGKLLTDVTIEFADGTVVSGDVYLATAEYAGNHDGENTYNVTLQSSGAWTTVFA